MKNKFFLVYSWLIRSLLFFLPDIPFLMRFRGCLYGLGMRSCGSNFQVAHDVTIRSLPYISIGKDCFLGNQTIILGSGSLILEDQVLVGPHCIIALSNHSHIRGSFRYGKRSEGHIVLRFGSWVAGNCTVLKGTILPAGSVLAAGSTINTALEHPNAIYAGSPARFIKPIDHVSSALEE